MTCVNGSLNNLDKEPSSLFTTIYELMYKSVEAQSVPQSILIIAGYQYKSALKFILWQTKKLIWLHV